MPIELDVPATLENFDEVGYLSCNPDVAGNVLGTDEIRWASGRQHFEKIGHVEGRKVRQVAQIEKAQEAKIARIEPFLLKDRPHKCSGAKYDFLPATWPRMHAHPVPSNNYDDYVMGLINEGGLILDCGAGQRSIYYENVVNFEISDYVTTDVLGVGESLPFKDDTFDGIISIAVLEHVRDPFRCASEIQRVLNPAAR